MINPNELRIGNKVYGNAGADTMCTITGINNYGDFATVHAACELDGYSGISATPKEFNPIPLTEQKIKKYGFSEKWQEPIPEQFKGSIFAKANSDNSIMLFIVLCKDNENLALINDGRSSIFLPIKVKYEHDLQNLWFALTGEELI